MELDSPLTMIGIIATILSMAFALAALLNSRRKQASKPGVTKTNAPDNAPPFPEMTKIIKQRLAEEQTGNTIGAAALPPTASLFKQIGPQGSELTSARNYDDTEYIWE